MSAAAILKAIDVEHARKCKAARTAYEKRMQTPRRWVEDARKELARMERALASHERSAGEEQQAVLVEAQLWRDEARAAVTGKHFKVAASFSTERETVHVGYDRAPVSLPKLSCLSEVE